MHPKKHGGFSLGDACADQLKAFLARQEQD